MPIDLTQPAFRSSLSSAVIRAQFAEVAAELDLKANADNPNITGSITLTDGGGIISGIPGIGGFIFLGGNGPTFDKKPGYWWYNYGAAGSEGQWAAWADAASLHFSTVTDDGVTSATDFMTVTRALTVPRLALTFGTDAQGTYPFSYGLNVIDHFSGATVDGIKIGAGGKTWGYLINTQKGNGWNVPQLYIHNFPFGAPNGINAPIRFDNTTTTGNNRAISIGTTDTSTTGALSVTSIEINQNSPPDRGGDTSGMYISQSGGGNGLSIYKLSSTFPNNGFGIECRSDGGATAIYTSAVNGDAAGIEVTGATGQGVVVWYKDTSSGGTATVNNRAFKVRDFANTTENFYVLMDGTIFSKSSITTGSTTLHSTSVALSNAAAAATATMTNAPTAGNPTKWISINDNGTVRRIPAW